MTITNAGSRTAKDYPLWLFIFLPAISMLLGWGLRGFIGGGPYGAMIPGALLMLTLSMLLDIPGRVASVIVVFATAGIAIGGEMTYGQTLGFLRNPETVWWGTCGTTVKGGVWGLVGGTFIGLGLLHQRIKTTTIIAGLILFLVGFVMGLKLINDPKLIYFSDRINKPRQESWAGLLFAAATLLPWLKVRTTGEQFTLVLRFAIYGLLGGALGFGLGGFWLVLGFTLGKSVWITEWWKLMEFSFGCIMGGFFGYAAWLSRKSITTITHSKLSVTPGAPFIRQFVIVLLVAVFIYLVLPLLDPFVEARSNADGFMLSISRTLARVTVNYTFIGLLLIMIAVRWPFIAFQLAVTITFSHTVIDLVEDWDVKNIIAFSPVIRIGIVLITSALVSYIVTEVEHSVRVLQSMFLILVWSTVVVAVTRMVMYSQFKKAAQDSLWKFIIGDLLVFNFFMIAAIVVSVLAINRISTRQSCD